MVQAYGTRNSVYEQEASELTKAENKFKHGVQLSNKLRQSAHHQASVQVSIICLIGYLALVGTSQCVALPGRLHLLSCDTCCLSVHVALPMLPALVFANQLLKWLLLT